MKFVVHPPRPTIYLPVSFARFKQDVRRISTFRNAPPPSKPAVVFSLNETDDKITLLDVF